MKSRTPCASTPVTVDISPIVSNGTLFEKQLCSRTLLRAAQKDGYALVTGTGIAEETRIKVLELARDTLRTPTGGAAPLRPPGYRGRQDLGENVTQGLRDHHAALDFMQVLPHDEVNEIPEHVAAMATASNGYSSADMQRDVEAYVSSVVRAGQAVMSAVGMALGVDDGVFNSAFEKPFWIARLIRYPGRGADHLLENENDPRSLGCGAHRDYGFLTFVTEFQDDATVSALQVSRSGLDEDFINAPVPPPGTFVLNFGDCLEALTGGAFHSTLHRVVRPHSERTSVAVFVEPCIKWRIQSLALPQTGWWRQATEESEPMEMQRRYEDRVEALEKYNCYGEYLYSKVSTNFDLHDSKS